MMSAIRRKLFMIGLLLAAVGLPAAALAVPAAPPGEVPMSRPAEEGSLYRADIYRDCLNFAGRWRCQTCNWVRRCDRSGCRWEQKCRWGPPVPPLPQ